MSEYSDLANEFGASMVRLIEDLAEGGKDLAGFATIIAKEASAAAASGDEEAIGELQDQLLAVAEIKRIRLREGGWEVLWDLIEFGVKALAIALKVSGGLP